MAGIKGKTGIGKNPNKGTKGYTNNPSGKPVGSKNKVQLTIKKRIEEFVNDDFDTFITEIEGLEVRDRVKAKTELIKLVVPRPLNEDEKNADRIQSEFMKRLFGSVEEE